MSWLSNLFSGSTETATQQTTIPEWMIPFVQNFAQSAQNAAQMPYQSYGGQTVASMNPFTAQALNAQAARAVNGSPVMDAGSGELQKTLSGGYLNSNPYLNGIIDKAGQDITRNMTNIDARTGSFGNSGVQEATSRALADSATGIRYNDYNTERGRMQSALSMAPTYANQDYTDAQQLAAAGQGFQNYDQANLTDQYQRWQEAQQYPYKQLDTMGKGLGVNTGSTTTVQTPGTSPMATGLGTAASLYSLGNTKQPTVICTELHRQGLMPDDIYRLDQAYGAMLAKRHPAVYAGYIRMAVPVVGLMQKSRIATTLVNILAKPWAKEMAHRMGKPKGSLVGKAIIKVGYPLCRMVSRRSKVKYG